MGQPCWVPCTAGFVGGGVAFLCTEQGLVLAAGSVGCSPIPRPNVSGMIARTLVVVFGELTYGAGIDNLTGVVQDNGVKTGMASAFAQIAGVMPQAVNVTLAASSGRRLDSASSSMKVSFNITKAIQTATPFVQLIGNVSQQSLSTAVSQAAATMPGFAGSALKQIAAANITSLPRVNGFLTTYDYVPLTTSQSYFSLQPLVTLLSLMVVFRA